MNGALLGLGFALTLLTFFLGGLIQVLPIPRRSIKLYGPVMMWDAIIAQLAMGSISAIQILVKWITDTVSGVFAPFTNPTGSSAIILAQLVSIDAAILLLISAISSTVILAPVAELLSRMLGSAANWVTNAIIFWIILQIAIQEVSKGWVVLVELGLVFFALPFRLGRRLAGYLISTATVASIALPLLPSIALWLEAYIGYERSISLLEQFVNDVTTNPFLILQLPTLLAAVIGNLLAAIVIALILFPFSYLFMIAILARSLANLIAGSSTPSQFMMTPVDYVG